MVRDMIDCLMAGWLLSFHGIWIIEDKADQIIIMISAAMIFYILLLFAREVHEWIEKYSTKNTGR